MRMKKKTSVSQTKTPRVDSVTQRVTTRPWRVVLKIVLMPLQLQKMQ